jgi:EpsG family
MINLTILTFSTIIFIGILSSIFRLSNLFSKVLYYFTGAILIFFAAFREIGSDQDSVAYERYYGLDDYTMSIVAEPTFLYIARISRYFFFENGLIFLFFIYAAIGVYLKLSAISKLTNLKWLSVIVYFSTYFLLHEFTQIRAGIASGLLLLAIKPIADRNLGKFLFVIASASLFHYSAIVAFPLYFLGNGKINWKNIIVLSASIPVGAVIHFTQFDILVALPIKAAQLKLETYYAVEELRNLKLNVFNSLYLIRYALLYIFLIFAYRIEKHNPYFPILLKIYTMSLFSYLVLSKNAVLAMRISELYGVVEILLIPLIYYAIRQKVIAILSILVFSLVSFGINIYWTELVRDVF